MKDAPRLHVCGHFQVHLPDSASPVRRLRTRKTEWLCCLLAVRRGRWQARESLIERFWPEDDLLAARRKLRLALHSIRQVFGDALQTEGDKVCLDGIWVDAIDQLPEQLDDFDLLLGEHEGTLADLLPTLESAWIRDLTACMSAEGAPNDKVRTALKLSSLAPADTAASAVIADSRLASQIVTAGQSSPISSLTDGERLLASLILHLLDGREPVAAALIGPPGVGKTHLARRLIPFAQQEEITPLFVSLQGVSDVQTLEALVNQALLASQGLSAPLQVRDLASTLLILDNVDGIGPEAQGFFTSLLVEGSPIRLLITLPEDRFEGLTIFRLRPMALPKEASSEGIHSSEAARFFCLKAGIDLAQADPETIYTVCLESGGLPLALQHSAKELLFSGTTGFSENGRRTSLHHAVEDRLRHGYARLSSSQKEALGFLRLLGPQFHPVLACSLGLDQSIIQQLWERSWIQHSPDGRAFEILPSILSFIEAQNSDSQLPCDWGERLAVLSMNLIETNYLQSAEIFGPSTHLLERALGSREGLKAEVQDWLFSALYFCQLRKADLSGVASLGVTIYGDSSNDAWKRERALNFFGSAAFFHHDFQLAERIFRRLVESSDKGLRSIAYANSGLIAQALGRNTEAVDLLATSLAAEDLKPRQRMTRLNNLAHALAGEGRLDEARQAAESTLAGAGELAELSELKSLALVSLGGICLCEGDTSQAQDWADRAVASWGSEGPMMRRLEAIFLSLSVCASHSPAQILPTLEQLLPRASKGAPAAVHYWSQFAAGVLARAGRREEGLKLIKGRSWPTTPFWLTPFLGEEPEGWEDWTLLPSSNKERWFLFINALKRL